MMESVIFIHCILGRTFKQILAIRQFDLYWIIEHLGRFSSRVKKKDISVFCGIPESIY